MKFSFRQILASAVGAMLAAFIASLFGVKGTIIGVAIGSAAATFGTALVSQSIERGHEAVKQVVERSPDGTSLLRRLGGTSASGDAVSEPAESSAMPEPAPSSARSGDQTIAMTAPDAETTEAVLPLAAAAETAATIGHDPVTEPLPVSSTSADPVTAELRPPAPMRRSIPWRAIAGTAAVVFVLSLGVVTGIEALAGHPLSDLFSYDKSNDPSLGQFFNPGPPATTTTTTPTTSTTTTSSTSTTTTSSTTTTTTPGSSTTTSTPSGGSTTTTTGLNLFGTTTTIPAGG